MIKYEPCRFYEISRVLYIAYITHIQTAERLWDSTLGLPARENGYGLIDDCTTSRTGEKQINGGMLRPDDPDMEKKKDDCFRRAGYLAKTNTKGNAPKGQRLIGIANLPPLFTRESADFPHLFPKIRRMSIFILASMFKKFQRKKPK